MTQNTFSVPSKAEVRQRVLMVSEGLKAFLRGSEDVFLDTARRLKGLEGRALELVRSSAGAVEGGDGDAGDLGRELEAVQEHLEKSGAATRSASALLGSLVQRIDGLSVDGRGFEELSASLRVLGLLTRVENARGGHRLDTVAEEVRRLSAQLESSFGEVLDRASALRTSAARARRSSESSLSQQTKHSSAYLATAKEGLQRVGEFSHAAADITAKAGHTTDEVVKEVKGILVLLQTHDTARQMMEHIISELEELLEDRQLSEAALRREAAALGALEARQLAVARSRLAEAISDMGRRLSAVGASVRSLADETRAMASDREGAASVLDSMDRSISGTTRLLKGQLALEQEIHGALGEVIGAVPAIVGCVKALDDVGAAVRILAVNGIVQTAQVGVDRAVFAALAGQMSDIAKSVATRSAAVTERVEAIERESHRLHTEEIGSQLSRCNALVGDLEGLLARTSSRHQAVLSRVRTLVSSAGLLDSELGQLKSRLDREATRLGTLEPLLAELQRLGSVTLDDDDDADAPQSQRLESARARYTMDIERAVHQNHDNDLTALVPVAAATEFGDNIELF